MIIYGLFDPRNSQLRYVGFTSKTLARRLMEHCKDPSKTHKGNWIRSLKAIGLKPEIEVLQTTTERERVFDEQWNIAYYRSLGCDLTNGTLGGDGKMGFKASAEQRRKMSIAKKNISTETRRKMAEGHQNRNDREKHFSIMLSNAAKSSMIKKRKMTDEQVSEAKQLHTNGMTFKQLGERYGVTSNAVWFNVRGKLKYQKP